MNKNFYVIVPLGESIFPAAGGYFSKIFGAAKPSRLPKKLKILKKPKKNWTTGLLLLFQICLASAIRGAKVKNRANNSVIL